MKINRFSFNNVVLRDEGEFLCLTDMWRAAGAADAKRPSDWLALPGTRDFAEYLNAEKSGIDLVRTQRGGTDPGTWAHWQLGMAYAKYLSPAFHAWCNEVVRKVMRGGGDSGAPPAAALVEIVSAVQSLASSVLEQTKAIAEIRVELRQLAARGAACITRAEAKSLAARIVRVLASAGWVGAGCRYDNLPAHAYPQAERALSVIESDLLARREKPEGPKPVQLSLLKTLSKTDAI
jgi:hypothetical protein